MSVGRPMLVLDPAGHAQVPPAWDAEGPRVTAGAAPDARFRTAYALSLAVHLAALVALGLLPQPRLIGDTDGPAAIVRLEHRVVPVVAVIHRPAAPHHAPVATPIPILALAPTRLSHRAGAAVAHPGLRVTARAARQDAPVQGTTVERSPTPVAAAPATPNAATVAVATPTDPPVPEVTAAPPRTALRDGPFGADYDPMFVPPGMLATVRAQLGTHVTIRVAVDADGRATDVTFVRFPDDAATRERVRAQLLAAHYDAGQCDGVKCDKVLEIRT